MGGRLESRRLVTVVFSDLAGSTALAERLDPEPLAHVLAEYFERMAAVLTSHGGSVREFIGDAVMAVFGIPELHEDDAVRAVRASMAMSDELERLNHELTASHGIALLARTGMNTGEILAGRTAAGQEMVLGDAINVAARLAAVAGEGETLVGEGTHRLVADLVVVEEVDAVPVRGRSQPVRAWRLLGERPRGARARVPLVGRAEEMDLIEREFEVAVDRPQTRVVVLLGEPGIGKSRLIEEGMSALEHRALILYGQCLSYGGFGLSHLIGVVRSALSHQTGSGTTADIEAAFGARSEMVREVLESLSEGRPPEHPHADTLWAVQQLVLALAARRPVLLALEDVHLASDDAWELVRGQGRAGRELPILILCSARPELVEGEDRWSEEGDGVAIVRVGPLPDDAALHLVEAIMSSVAPRRRSVDRAVEVARGNPLFLRETALELVDASVDAPAPLPRSIFAMLSARLERLSADQRSTLSRASVIGPTFDLDLLRGLGDEAVVDTAVGDLRARGLLEPTQDDLLRFNHELTRDAAYRATPKARRAAIHERVADLLARAEPLDDALVGHHYERAFRDRQELGIDDERSGRLTSLAATHLRAAGRKALGRGEAAVAAGLLERSGALERTGTEEEALGDIAHALALFEIGRREDADRLLAVARERAVRVGMPRARARAEVEYLHCGFQSMRRETAADARRLLPRAVRALHESGDLEGLARAYLVAAELAWYGDHRPGKAEHHQRRAIRFAQRAGARSFEVELLVGLASVWLHGPLSADEGLARCRETLDAVGTETPRGELLIRTFTGGFEALTGDLRRARGSLAEAESMAHDLGVAGGASRNLLSEVECFVEQVADRYDLVEGLASDWQAALEGALPEELLASIWVVRARASLELGRLDEADREASLVRSSPNADDPWLAQAHAVSAVVAAARGRHEEAVDLARRSVARVDVGEFPVERARVRVVAARALAMCGSNADARVLVEEAIRLFEDKGDVPEATQAREFLERISNGPLVSLG